MSKSFVFGVDIGATWVRVAISDPSGNIVIKDREPIDTSSNLVVSKQIEKIGRNLCQRVDREPGDLSGIGIASAGPMNRKEGKLVNPSNIPLGEVPLAGPLEKSFDTKVELINDGVSAVLAESKYGAGQEYDNLVYITISTGIGGGVIVDDHLLIGKNGNAAEVGHFTIDEEEKLKCGCGRKGHWEAYCSGSNIPDFVRTSLESIEPEARNSPLLEEKKKAFRDFQPRDLFEYAKGGDELALNIVEEIGRLNAIGFATVTEAYDPELITVGGGVALNNPELILEPIRKKITDHTQNEVPEIKITPLNEENVLYGAIARALTLSENLR
ncbi:MAG: ROK family protein [Candidatus Bipolaricaulota bacterium]|nr:ROK family protein [Candidatus Bipolaricaulota bacterium]MBS3791297.1 ROK family protein [Candidatus Bipolaricaulota bacterium]